jgi:xylulokinase
MNKTYFLGIEISTPGVKTILIDDEYQIVASAWTEHPTYTPHPLWVEQNPEDWWIGTVASIRKIFEAKNILPNQIHGISLTGQMHGLVLLDGSGSVIRPCILWNDQRSILQCETMNQRIGEKEIIQYTGNRVYPGFTAPKVVWVQENEPDLYRRTAKILLPKDYIRYRLSGSYLSEVTDASGTSMFNVLRRKWSKDMLIALHISPALLPDMSESLTSSSVVSPEAARITGIFPGTPIIAGASSHVAQSIAAGICSEGDLSVSISSSGVAFAPINQFNADSDGKIHCFCNAWADKWHLMGVMLSAGSALRWYKTQFTPQLTYHDMSQIASQAPAGSEGLLFLPYLNGERTPHSDPYAKGVFFGFSMRHQQAHFIRSLMEGISFGILDSIELIKTSGININRIKIFGGAGKSKLWLQIMSDILNDTICLNQEIEEPAYGAALIAGLGTHCFTHDSILNRKRSPDDYVFPSPNAKLYAELYPMYKNLYTNMYESFQKLHSIVDNKYA